MKPALAPVVGRDRVVTIAGRPIGTVCPDNQKANHRWRFEHVSGITLAGLHPDRAWNRTVQVAWTKREAAAELAALHAAIQQLQNHPELPPTKVDAAPRRRPRISDTSALAILMGMSRDFATAWTARAGEDFQRVHDAVADVQEGLTPRRALQLSGFTLTQ